MSKWSDKTTNQLLLDVTQMKEKHEALKMEMVRLYDELEAVEKDFSEANRIINERLRGKNG